MFWEDLPGLWIVGKPGSGMCRKASTGRDSSPTVRETGWQGSLARLPRREARRHLTGKRDQVEVRVGPAKPGPGSCLRGGQVSDSEFRNKLDRNSCLMGAGRTYRGGRNFQRFLSSVHGRARVPRPKRNPSRYPAYLPRLHLS